MKIGLDVHGVIDTYPEIFRDLSGKWLKKGFEVHILTGKEWKPTEMKLKKWGVKYSHSFSIVDYHLSQGTEMVKKESGWWMEETAWNRSKGDYCRRTGITLHFDNDLKYAEWFPSECNFFLVSETNFRDCLKVLFPSLLIKG